MSNNYGTNTPQGFLPHTPSVEDIMSRLVGRADGWDGIVGTPAAQELTKPADDALMSAYAWCSKQSQFQAVLEDILNATLRIAPLDTASKTSIEAAALHAAERNGQNAIAVMILKRIVDARKREESATAAPKSAAVKNLNPNQTGE